MIEPRSHNRIGHIIPYNFLEIALASLKKSEELEKQIKNIESEGKFNFENQEIFKEHIDIEELKYKRLNETIISTVFLSSFLESYFFEFAATALGQSYAKKHTEKIDIISKLVLIPRLVTGKDLDKSKYYWADIIELIKWRNRIIHNKTKDASEFIRNVRDYNPTWLFEEFKLRSFFNAIKELFKDLESMDPEGMHWLKLTKLIKK